MQKLNETFPLAPREFRQFEECSEERMRKNEEEQEYN